MTRAVAIHDLLRRVRRVELAALKSATGALAGDYASVFKGRGFDFEELREYAPGDDVRTIDHHVTARAGKPYVRVHREERDHTLILAVDISASCDFGTAGVSKRELAAEAAATLAACALRTGDRVGLYLFTEDMECFLPPARGPVRLPRLVRELLFFPAGRRGSDVGRSLLRLNRLMRRPAIIALFSDFHAAPPVRTLAVTAARHDLFCLHLADAREGELPDLGHTVLEDLETGARATLDTGDPAVRECFAAAARRAAEATDDTFRRAGIDCVKLDTRAPVAARLRHFFHHRRRRD